MNVQNSLYKIRSVRGCLKASLELYGSNLRAIFRCSWLPAVIFGIGASVVTFCQSIADPTHFSLQSVALTAVGGIIVIAALIWLRATIVSQLSGNGMRQSVFKLFKQTMLICFLFTLFLLTTAVSYHLWVAPRQTAAQPSLPIFFIWLILLLVVFVSVSLPLCYSSMKYYLEPKQKIKDAWCKNYIGGIRFEGYIFLTCLLIFIISAICYAFVSMPSLIISTANKANQFSMFLGDPNGVTPMFYCLMFISNFICYFILSYVIIWSEMVLYYVYGSLEARRAVFKEIKRVEDN